MAKKIKGMPMNDKLLKTIKKVVQNWGVIEATLFVIFAPFALAYLALRCIQEWEIEPK